MSSFPLEPRNDVVIVRRVKASEEKTDAGVIIPAGGSSSDFSECEVLAAGPDANGLERGDRVLAKIQRSKAGPAGTAKSEMGTSFMVDGETVMLLAELQIVAVIRRAAPVTTGH